MDSSLQKKHQNKKKRAVRTRSHLRGTSDRPRLCVLRSNKHIHAQLIDDESSVTVASASTVSKEFKSTDFNKKSKEAAKQVGLSIAKQAIAKNLKTIVFDRGPFKYHGVVAALADGAREGGLEV